MTTPSEPEIKYHSSTNPHISSAPRIIQSMLRDGVVKLHITSPFIMWGKPILYSCTPPVNPSLPLLPSVLTNVSIHVFILFSARRILLCNVTAVSFTFSVMKVQCLALVLQERFNRLYFFEYSNRNQVVDKKKNLNAPSLKLRTIWVRFLG